MPRLSMGNTLLAVAGFHHPSARCHRLKGFQKRSTGARARWSERPARCVANRNVSVPCIMVPRRG